MRTEHKPDPVLKAAAIINEAIASSWRPDKKLLKDSQPFVLNNVQDLQGQGNSGRIALLEKRAQKGDGKGSQLADSLDDIILELAVVEVHCEELPGQRLVDESAGKPDESAIRLGKRGSAHPAHGIARQVLRVRPLGHKIHDCIILGRIGPVLEEKP